MLNRSVQPKVREIEQLAVQKPQRRVLSNGVVLNVLNNGDNEVIRVDFLLEGGRWQQSQPLQAVFTNRMLREGTLRYTAQEIAEKLDYYGAWLELSATLEHSFVTLYSLNKYFPQTLEILESIIKEPIFPEKELGVVVDNNMQKFMVNASKVSFLAQRALVKSIFGEQHPCGRLAQLEDYRRIHPEILRAFYARHYHSGNCTIYLSGKVSEDSVRRVEELFGNAPFGTDFRKPEQKECTPISAADRRSFVEYADAMQSAVYLGALSLGYTHPDYLKTRVLMTVFGGYFGSRLMSNIREEKGYTYGISAGIVPFRKQGVVTVRTETANEFVEPLIGEVYHEIERLQNDLVPEEELGMVKNYMLGEMCRNHESAFSLADSWIFVQVSGFTDTYFEDALHATMEATPQEIRELAGKYLCKENLKEVVAGKKM